MKSAERLIHVAMGVKTDDFLPPSFMEGENEEDMKIPEDIKKIIKYLFNTHLWFREERSEKTLAKMIFLMDQLRPSEENNSAQNYHASLAQSESNVKGPEEEPMVNAMKAKSDRIKTIRVIIIIKQ